MSRTELVGLFTCDLTAIVRGRMVPAAAQEEHLRTGIGWVPANHALLPLGGLAEPSPFGSTGDLRLLADEATRIRVAPEGAEGALELLLCDIVETDGSPWSCCPRRFLAGALEQLRERTGAELRASFEHEFLLGADEPAAPAFSLEGARRAGPFAGAVMGALAEAGLEPERFFAEYAPGQYEIPLAPASGIAAADRAVLMREVIREVARRHGRRASFVPLFDPAQAGNGVHIHMSLHGRGGEPLLHDPAGPAGLSEAGLAFAAGILAHARALSALCAPSPVSGERLRPHHWSAGAACLAIRNREALLRIPPVVELGAGPAGEQLRIEFRGADATANPHLALGAIILAGLAGIEKELPAPPLLQADPATLGEAEAERFGVGALPGDLGEALDALQADAAVMAFLGPELAEAYLSLKRSELAAVAELSLEEACARYGAIY